MRENHVDPVLAERLRQLEAHGVGAVMRRATRIALLGATTAVGGGAWYVLAQRDAARDVHLGGVRWRLV